jgi:hypothetical protein
VLEPDVATSGPLAAIGAPTAAASVKHDGTFALVFVRADGANKTAVTGITWDGVAMHEEEDSIRAFEPWPWASVFSIDGIKPGTAAVVAAKNTAVNARLVVRTYAADGPVSVVAVKGGAGANAEPAVPTIAVVSEGIAVAFISAAHDDLPEERAGQPVASLDEGSFVWDLQEQRVREGNVSLSWRFAAIDQNARVGVLLKDPNPPPPPTEATIDFETNDLSQAELVQALPGRIAVIDAPPGAPAAAGSKVAEITILDGDVEPMTKAERAELTVGLDAYEGTHQWCRYVGRILEIAGFGFWEVLAQLHDTGSGSSPPQAHELWYDEATHAPILTLQDGDGSPVFWRTPATVGEWYELIWENYFSTTSGGYVGNVFYNGVPHLMTNGAAVFPGANFRNPPGYWKVGNYRANASVNPSRLQLGLFEIRTSPIAPTFRPHHGHKIARTESGGLWRPSLIRP